MSGSRLGDKGEGSRVGKPNSVVGASGRDSIGVQEGKGGVEQESDASTLGQANGMGFECSMCEEAVVEGPSQHEDDKIEANMFQIKGHNLKGSSHEVGGAFSKTPMHGNIREMHEEDKFYEGELPCKTIQQDHEALGERLEK